MMLRLVPAIAALALAGCASLPGVSAQDGDAAIDAAVAADRAFAERAAREGQWTAFRATATTDAVMFLPEPVEVSRFLAGRANPPASVRWWPTEAYASCDGRTVATRGGADWPGGQHSHYLTWWGQQPDGAWRWSMDTGATVATAPAAGRRLTRRVASCANRSAMPSPFANDQRHGASADGTLRWALEGDGPAARVLVRMWDGSALQLIADVPIA